MYHVRCDSEIQFYGCRAGQEGVYEEACSDEVWMEVRFAGTLVRIRGI